jgi:hypothetical protein
MVKVEILNDNNDGQQPVADIASKPPDKMFLRLNDSREAVFQVPTIELLIGLERNYPKIEGSEIYRKLAEICLIDWAGQPKMPPDEEIDIADDFAVIDLFSLNAGDSYEVLPDKSHKVVTEKGSIIFRRPTRPDVRKAEQLSKRTSEKVLTDIMWACELCTSWWNSSRKIMPADFYELNFHNYASISTALQAFFPKRS